ncbi:MAG: PAS domain S-box protein [Candidatus Wukongarchaeota archaeon]|nr:PAS domain S-box protein [Candidatus Wukongarchaeota archaeon]
MLNVEDKTQDQLIDELVELSQRIVELEKIVNQHKWTEEALKRSEKRFRELTELLPEIVFETDIEGNFIFVNQVGFDIFGYTRADFDKGLNALQMIAPEDQDRAKENIRRVLSGEDLGIREYMAQRKDGSRFPVIIHSSSITDEEGKTVGLRGIVIDITERKKTETALRESEKKYRDLVENINDVIYAIDKDGVMTYVSPVIESITGYSPSEIIGSHSTVFIHKEDVQRMSKAFQKILSGHLEPGEYRILTKSGEIRWIRTDSKPIYVENQVIGVRGVLTDITERKKAEEALKESEDKFRTLAEQLPNMIFINKKGKIVYTNKKSEEIMGYTKDEFYSPNFDFLILVAPESLEKVKLALSKHMKGEEVEPYDYTLLTKDGKKIEAILTTKLINYEGEKAILGIVTDITDRKRAEEALKKRAEELEKSKAELQQSLEELLKRVELEHEILITQPIPEIDIEERGSLFLYPVDRENEAYAIFRSRKDANRPALAITRTFPPRFQRKIGREIEMVWLTSNRVPELVCVDPSDTMTLLLVISEFFKRAPEGVILFEGIEYIVSITGFERFLRIVQLLNDKIAMLDGTIYMIVDLGVLKEKEARYVLRESLQPPEGVEKEAKGSGTEPQ